MPAILTHHLFGEDALAQLPKDSFGSQEELVAFLLGNQGPDPLLARFTCIPPVASTCHAVARRMHAQSMADTLWTMREEAKRRADAGDGIAWAFTLGFSAHYVLDCLTHPLILALVAELQLADPSLANASPELHAIIEADIDVWMLWQKRHKTICEAPASLALVSTAHIDQQVSELIAHTARSVFDLELGTQEFAKAVRDYRCIYQLMDPPAKRLPRMLGRIESSCREVSRIEAQRHPITASDECASANLRHHPWRHPFTDELSTASFADLFHDALLAWRAFAQRLDQGERYRIDAMINETDYYGKPLA